MNVDETIDRFMAPLSDGVASVIFYTVPVLGQDIKLILVWLVAASLFFTVYLGFINIRCFSHAINILRGKYDKPGEDGNINRFQALTTSLSGTVGLGNIAGVAVAISLGGPGAAFWMVLMGLFGMSTKMVEVMLGVKYRRQITLPDGKIRISGGPMYYLRDAFNNRNIPYVGNFMALFFAAACVLGTFGAASLFQTNQAYQQLLNVTGGEASYFADKGWLFGLFMVLVVGLVIIGGIKSIARVASRIVPLMGGLYLLAGLLVIAMNAAALPGALATIFHGAFSFQAGGGAFMGALLMGVQRASFSNEAGLGSAAIAHASVKTDEPVSQGLVGMLGPFIDTVIICMVTALVIVITHSYNGDGAIEGVELTSRAFAQSISWFPYVLALTVFLFAYSTIISWSYYGEKGFTFLFGQSLASEIVFKALFCVFIVIGASAELSSVIQFTDSMVFAMAIPNIIALYLLAPEVKADVRRYLEKVKQVS